MMSSRQRLLTALNDQVPDHVPCSFMLFNGLKAGCRDYLEFVQRQLDMGLDAYVQIPPRPPVVRNDYYNLHGLPVSYPPGVAIREWKEDGILFKEYVTPAGTLRAEVCPDDEWRWGDHVPFLDDYLVGRSRKFIVDSPAELPALRALLSAPTPIEVAAFQVESAPVLDFARQHNLLVAGGWGVGADMVGWVYGLQRMIYAAHDEPEFITDLLEIIAAWNRTRMEVVLGAGIDLYIKRAWYENCDFWTPRSFRRFILSTLQAEVDQAHRHGAKFGYIITANCMPLLDQIAEAGVDAVIGVDPAQWDLAAAKARLGGKVCLWGGVNGHLTVEHGTPEDVRTEVRRAVETLAPGGGFILSPVDNVREYTPQAQQNVSALLDEWKRLAGMHGEGKIMQAAWRPRHATAMTGKERVMASLRGDETDRPCWSPVMDHYFTNSLPDQGYPELDVPDACRLIGADIIERHSPTLSTFEDDCVVRRTERQGDRERMTIETPVGNLWMERGYTKGSVHVTRWPVRTVENVKVWQFVAEHTHYAEHYAAFERRQELIGEDGIATSSGPFTPITTFLEDLCGAESTYYLLADHPAEVEACFEAMQRQNMEQYRLLAAGPSPVVIDYEDTSSTLISPAYYSRYCAPLIDDYAHVCHAAGKLFITHMCGKLSQFNAQLKAGQQDGIDSVCPPTTGDLWAHEARAAWGSEKIILGGIEPPLLQRMTVEQTRVYIADILDRMPTFRRFILSTGDATSYGTPIANLRAVTDVVASRGWK